jgi:hypothetical protein
MQYLLMDYEDKKLQTCPLKLKDLKEGDDGLVALDST